MGSSIVMSMRTFTFHPRPAICRVCAVYQRRSTTHLKRLLLRVVAVDHSSLINRENVAAAVPGWLPNVLAVILCLTEFPSNATAQCMVDCPEGQAAAWISKYVDPLADTETRPPIPTWFPPLPELQLPRYEKVRLANGLDIFLLEDHEVPLVRGTLLMRGGKYASPPDKVGVASLAASVQRSGGSTAHPDSALDERLEELAAHIEAAAGPLAVTLDFSCMREDVGEVMELVSEVVRTPALPDAKLTLAKAQARNTLEHQYDNTSAVAQRKLLQLIYGEDSIYARQATLAQVQAIQQDDLRQFINQWERPDAAVLGVAGDFKTSDMLLLLGQHFGTWAPAAGQPAGPPPAPHADIPQQTGAGKVFLVDRPGATQASVAMGEPGVMLGDPDSYALDVLGGIFNSFGGRLFDEIRSKEGLTYSVSGGWDTPPDHQGAFVASGSTSSPAQFTSALQRVLGSATQEAPAEGDVTQAKEEALNSFVFNFSSTAAQLQRTIAYHLLGLPQDYLFSYKRFIEGVTAEDVLGAAQRHLHPVDQTVVVAADAAVVGPQLQAAGFDVEPLALGEL